MIERNQRSAGPEGQPAPQLGPRVRAPSSTPSVTGSTFSEVLGRLGTQIDRGEALVRRAVSGGHSGMGAGDLIALQAGIYRYTEAVDLAAKLVDRASSAVKTTLQGSG